MSVPSLAVAVIGGGPIGLAAAARLLARGLEPLVLEAGSEVGHAVRARGHIRMFLPLAFDTDAEAPALAPVAATGGGCCGPAKAPAPKTSGCCG